MASIAESVGAVTGAVRSVLFLTRHSRLRVQIRETLELLAMVPEGRDLTAARADLCKVVTLQSASLLALVDRPPARRDWSGFWIGSFMTAGMGALAWWCWRQTGNWWGWPLFVVVAFVGLACLSVTYRYVAPARTPGAAKAK